MDQAELVHLVNELLQEPDETEWLEFKENRCEPQLIGEDLSALSNSACLLWKPKGYLAFGIRDKTHEVTGTDFDPRREKGKGNQDLMIWLASGIRPNVGVEAYSVAYQGKKVVLFEISAAIDTPVSFYGKEYIRIGKSKTELSKHPEKAREIWSHREDWSAQICEKATLDDLEPEAIRKARREFQTKIPLQARAVDGWDDIQFLNKAKVTIQGRITNTSILLLGKPESASLLTPAVAKMSWVLKDSQNKEKDYEHFGPPFLLNVDRLFARVRNNTGL